MLKAAGQLTIEQDRTAGTEILTFGNCAIEGRLKNVVDLRPSYPSR